ncbi:MAG: HEPN family nuclease [Candidatus Onthoplasma sp.]
MIIKDEYDSFILQALATTSLLAELSNNGYLSTEHFKNLKFENEFFKKILKLSSIGNPACLQMFLYALLVIPKELEEKGQVKLQLTNLNNEIDKLKISLVSTYTKEPNFKYIKHMRNALSHGNCFFSTINGNTIVAFKDCNTRNKKEYCEITISTFNVGTILMYIQKILLSYFKDKYNL